MWLLGMRWTCKKRTSCGLRRVAAAFLAIIVTLKRALGKAHHKTAADDEWIQGVCTTQARAESNIAECANERFRPPFFSLSTTPSVVYKNWVSFSFSLGLVSVDILPMRMIRKCSRNQIINIYRFRSVWNEDNFFFCNVYLQPSWWVGQLLWVTITKLSDHAVRIINFMSTTRAKTFVVVKQLSPKNVGKLFH